MQSLLPFSFPTVFHLLSTFLSLQRVAGQSKHLYSDMPKICTARVSLSYCGSSSSHYHLLAAVWPAPQRSGGRVSFQILPKSLESPPHICVPSALCNHICTYKKIHAWHMQDICCAFTTYMETLKWRDFKML